MISGLNVQTHGLDSRTWVLVLVFSEEYYRGLSVLNVCVSTKFHITAQSGPVILVIISQSYGSSQGGISATYSENL